MTEAEKLLLYKYKPICMTNEEYMKAEGTGMIPRFLATAIAGPAKLNQKSEGTFTNDKFVNLILDYNSALYLEEALPESTPFEVHTCMNFFKDLLVISYVNSYDQVKGCYNQMDPTIRPVAIPLCNVKDVRKELLPCDNDCIRYGLTITLTEGFTYTAELFTVKNGKITADANWSLEVNKAILQEELTYDIYDPAKIDETIDLYRKTILDKVSQTQDFNTRFKIMEEIFEEDYLPRLREYIYAAEDSFYDVIIESMDHLKSTEAGKNLTFELRPILTKREECEQQIVQYTKEYEKHRRKLWGAAFVKQFRMKKELAAMQDRINFAKRKKEAAQDELRHKTREILQVLIEEPSCK